MIHRHPAHCRELRLEFNDLDFCYLPRVASSVPSHGSELVCTVDSTLFFANGGHHLVFALDCEGGQGFHNPHCGPIYRYGKNLWSVARGFIVFGDGAVMAERWNGTAMPALAAISNTSGAVFDPAQHPVFTLRIVAGYRAGAWAHHMQIEIRAGEAAKGPILFAGAIVGAEWGWDWSGSSKAAIGGIASGFVPPGATGCVEQKVPRSAPNAAIRVSRFKLRMRQLQFASPL
ncbi:MAG: hypothetical protein IV104_09990 [Acidovorax sp.]|nr:hypothetical protein [Acidovorax sp.]